MSILKKAESTMAYFKAGFLGFQGTGKTYTAALLAIGICKMTGNNKVAFMDTETGSDFLLPKLRESEIEVFQVKSRSFSDLLDTIKECEKEKVGVLIVDSITHIWRDLCESYDKKLKRNGRLQFQDWAIIKGEWKAYTDLFVNSKVHLIVCGRAGFEYDYDFNEDGTKDLIKTGTKMKVENEFGFEPSLVVEMERATAAKDELDATHEIKDIQKRKDAKAEIRTRVGSKWIHRAHVLKDRTDTINGHIFDYPTFENFLPHFKALNIGGTQLGVDTSRTSEDRFDIEGKPQWARDQQRRKIAMEEIEGEITRVFPGQSAKEKKAKGDIVEYLLKTRSWTKVETLPVDLVVEAQKRVKIILGVMSNIDLLMENNKPISQLRLEEPQEDVPNFQPAGNEKDEIECPAQEFKKIPAKTCDKCHEKEGCPAQPAQ